MAGGEKLSKKKELAIAAILTCPTLKDAAKQIGISEPTLFRWLQRSDFQESLKQAKKQAVQQATSSLSQICHEAVHNLRKVMNDNTAPASSRVAAAKTVLDSGLRGIELEDLDARLANLEQQLAEESKGGIRRSYS